MGFSRKPLPSAEYLHARLQFINGILHWRERPRDDFRNDACWGRFNRNKAGNRADRNGNSGYKIIELSRSDFYAHRLVWKMVYGTEPQILDHIDGNRANNVIENLREATQSQNFFNAVRPKNNTSGYKGVVIDRTTGNWRAFIGHEGKARYLGSYRTREEAAEAYFAEAQRVAGPFARRG